MFQGLLERIQSKVAFKLGLAACLGWITGIWLSQTTNRPETLISGVWCAVSAVVVLQVHLGGTYHAALHRFLGVFIGSILGSIFTAYLTPNPLFLGISVFLTAIVCDLLNIKESIRIACLTVCVIMIFWGFHSESNPWWFAFFRFVDSCVGILIGLTIARLIWPFQAARKFRLNMSHILFNISRLYHLILESSDWDQMKNEECKILSLEIDKSFKENHLFLEEAKIELLLQPVRLDNWMLLQDYAHDLFKLILSLQGVYYKAKKIFDTGLEQQLDQTVGEISKALQHLSHALSMRRSPGELKDLDNAMAQLHVDLTRFRDTHTLRKFSLQDAESYYVFFFNLNAISEDLQKIAAKINLLYAELNTNGTELT